MALRVFMNIILGVTGSVSAYKTPWLVRDMRAAGHTVRVVMTPSAQRFVTPLALEATSTYPVITDTFAPDVQEGGSWHVHLAHWADIMIIAPCSATTLASLATGTYNNALLLVAASLPKHTPLHVAPAMDTDMYLQPAVQRNVAQLTADGVTIIDPAVGALASGLTGVGRLAEFTEIIPQQQNLVQEPRVQATGTHVVITAGPTHEPIDDVRYLGNHSTGAMGFALAHAARERGMLVTLVAGPVTQPTPEGVERIDVQTAQQMFEAVRANAHADVFIMAAAVADFTPAVRVRGKIKKQDVQPESAPTITLQQTQDILAYVGAQKKAHQTVVGFALESTNVLEYAQQKLLNKNADIIVANQAGIAQSGFGGTHNTITILTHHSKPLPYPPMPKRAAAEIILDAILELRAGSTTHKN